MGRAEWNALVAVGAILFVLGLKLASRDDPPPQEADLLPAAAVPAAGTDDAYPLFLKLNAAFPLTADERAVLTKHFDGKASSETAVAGYLARSTETLALFAELGRRSTFQDPNYRDLSAVGPATPVPQFFSVVAAAKLSSLQAEALLKKGRAAEALAQALTIVDAGRAFTRGHQQLIEYLVGLLVTDIGAKRALEIAASGKVDRARLVAAAAHMSAPSNAAPGLQEALRYQYLIQKHVLDHLPELAAGNTRSKYAPRNLMIAASAKGGWYIYMPNRTRALFADRFRRMITEAGKPCLLAAVPEQEPLPIGLRPNMVGRILYDIAIPSYQKIFARRCESDFRETAAAAAAAVRAYRLDHGRFPASLSELTPGYLATAPVDPFSGGAPLYSAETGELHSAGKDSEGKPL